MSLSLGVERRLRRFVRAMSAVAATRDLQHDRSVDDAVEESHRQWWIAEVIAPGVEVDVRRQCGRAAAMAGVDDFVEQAG